MIHYFIANISFDRIPDVKKAEKIGEKFVNASVKLIDFIYDAEKKHLNFSILGAHNLLLPLVEKRLKTLAKELKSDAQDDVPVLSVISFSPMQIAHIDEMSDIIDEHLKDFSQILRKGIVTFGNLADKNKIPFLKYYLNMEADEFMKRSATEEGFVKYGKEFVKERDDVLLVGVKPFPVVIFIKIAIDRPKVIENLTKKLDKFGKINYLIHHDKKQIVEEDTVLDMSYTYSVPRDTAVLAIKIKDYVKIPIHKIMIYIYDILDKHGCIPFDAEFAYPIPSEVIRIASKELFDKKVPMAELSKEIKKVLTIFRFDIESIFQYPSMILEKRYNISMMSR